MELAAVLLSTTFEKLKLWEAYQGPLKAARWHGTKLKADIVCLTHRTVANSTETARSMSRR